MFKKQELLRNEFGVDQQGGGSPQPQPTQQPVDQSQNVQQGQPTPQAQPQPQQPQSTEIDLSADALDERKPNFVPSIDGVNNVYLDKVTIGDYNGTTTLSFHFQQIIANQVVAEQEIRFFDPTENTLGNDPDKHKKQMIDTFNRIKHLFRGYISEEAVTGMKYPNFKAMCEALIQKLGTNHKGKVGKLYVTYSNKGYIQLPLYPINYLSTEFRPTTFEYDSNYHAITKPNSDSGMSKAPSSQPTSAEGAF